jgi:hypothetical protein
MTRGPGREKAKDVGQHEVLVEWYVRLMTEVKPFLYLDRVPFVDFRLRCGVGKHDTAFTDLVLYKK